LALCEQLGAPICGNALVEAWEECDGEPGCQACQDASEPAPLIVVDDVFAQTLVLLADGGVLIIEDGKGRVTRYDASGTVAWSPAMEEHGRGLAADSAGNVYVVGRDIWVDYGVPWVASWDATGDLRWSSFGTWFGSYARAAVDATRLVAAGTTEQDNSPHPRGLVAQYDLDGGLRWSEKLSSIMEVREIALVGDEIAVLGTGLDLHPILLRVDEHGAVRWSIEVVLVRDGSYRVSGVVDDLAGGVWIYGQRDEGPWARRLDADGVELDELGCLGATAGSISQMLVEPRGSLVVAILLSDEVLPINRASPWLAWVDGGNVTAGARLSNGDATLRTFGLGRWPDGTLAVGVQAYFPHVARVLVIEP
jgi:hypothetical protein